MKVMKSAMRYVPHAVISADVYSRGAIIADLVNERGVILLK